MRPYKVCWLSTGVSSFIAGYLAKNVDEYIYIYISDQHKDSMRFIKDCEKVLGKKVTIISHENPSVEYILRKAKFISSPYGSPCTKELKRKIRQKWEFDHKDYDLTYVWGFDSSETKRAERLKENMFEFHHEFPLIDNFITKEQAHGMLENLGIKRPKMYDMGYRNNNCVGCVKGGAGYWNKIRIDFPDVFEKRSKMERDIGNSILNGTFLDELDPTKGRNDEVIPECGIACELALKNE